RAPRRGLRDPPHQPHAALRARRARDPFCAAGSWRRPRRARLHGHAGGPLAFLCARAASGPAMRGARLLACALSALACGTHASPIVASTSDLGVVGNSGVQGLLRDGGASILLGGQVLWTFGDSLFPFQAADGSQLRTNTAALAP